MRIILEGALGDLRALIEHLEGCERLEGALGDLRAAAQRLEAGERLVLELAPAEPQPPGAQPPLVQALERRGLPPREAQIAALCYQGRSDAEIAEALHLSMHTVRWPWRKLYRRLDIHTRAAALRFVAEVLRGQKGLRVRGYGLGYEVVSMHSMIFSPLFFVLGSRFSVLGSWPLFRHPYDHHFRWCVRRPRATLSPHAEAQQKGATMEPALEVFVCGPRLRGDALTGVTVRDGAVVWEPGLGGELPPDPVEPIREAHTVVIGGALRLTLLVTACGVYLTDQTLALQPAAAEQVAESRPARLLALELPA